MQYFLGIDGGGTHTTAWLADERGSVLARAVTGPSNPLKVGFDASQHEILRAARRTRREAKLGRRPLDALCIGLAGVDRPPVYRRLLRWVEKSIPARATLLTSDAAVALQAAIGDTPGVMVISGTGSIAYGRDGQGGVLRSGGWGCLYDDLGSGYDIARKSIVAALEALDGRGPETILRGKICRTLGLTDISLVVLESLAPHEMAALLPLVLSAARRGDEVARRLCEEAGRDLAELALALLARLGWLDREAKVVGAGGVFTASARIRESFERHLARRAPRASVQFLRRPAVEGALALARKLARPQGALR